MGKPDTRLIPIPDWADRHPWPSVAGMRWLAFNRKDNGFARAFKKVGRRILVDEQIFFECVDEQNNLESAA